MSYGAIVERKRQFWQQASDQKGTTGKEEAKKTEAKQVVRNLFSLKKAGR